MSRVRDLIGQLCSNGIEFAPLGEIGTIFGGLTGKSKADFSNGEARYISYVNVFNNEAVSFDTDDFVRIRPGERQRTLQRGDILFTGSSETPDEVGMSSVVTSKVNEPLYLNSFCIGYRLDDPTVLDPEFAKHLFRSGDLRKQLIRTASGVTRFNVSKARLARVQIPLLPPEAQSEIARTLNQFIELEEALKEELEARRRQYAHYREELFSFRKADGIEWIPMGEVGRFARGRRFTKDDVVEVGIPCIHYGEIYTRYGVAAETTVSHVRTELAHQLRYAQPGDVVIAGVGETVEDVGKAVAWLGAEPTAIHDDTFLFRHEMSAKFVSYFLQPHAFHSQKGRYVARAKVKRLSAEGLAKIVMPVVPLVEQERIVSILDEFEALLNDVSVGLPAELSARRKQYEYYRDRLLTFREAA
jgi:type I restriction enzyme S subunit